MGDWRTFTSCRYESSALTATSSGTSLTAGSANTKTSWSQMIAATSFDAHTVVVSVNYATPAAGVMQYLIDIGVGGAGSEVVLIPNLAITNNTEAISNQVAFPVAVPAGVRLAVRFQSNVTSIAIAVSVGLIGGGLTGIPGFTSVVDYGTSTADSGGAAVDAGGTINTKGSWAQVTASTTRTHKALILSATIGANAAGTDSTFLLDIGVGGAGSETVLIPNIPLVQSGGSDIVSPPFSPAFPVEIPAGSRLAVRTQSSINNATDRVLDAALYGLS